MNEQSTEQPSPVTDTRTVVADLCARAGVRFDPEKRTIFVPPPQELGFLIRDIYLSTHGVPMSQPIPPPPTDNRSPTLVLEPAQAQAAVPPSAAPGPEAYNPEQAARRVIQLERRLELIRRVAAGDAVGVQTLLEQWQWCL